MLPVPIIEVLMASTISHACLVLDLVIDTSCDLSLEYRREDGLLRSRMRSSGDIIVRFSGTDQLEIRRHC
jgi:hypothetical protein